MNLEEHDFSRLLPDVKRWKRGLKTAYANITSIRQVKYFLHLMDPRHIIRNEWTNKAWDRELREILDNPESFEHLDDFHVKMNGVNIWICNYPYAFGSRDHDKRLPSRRTCVRLKLLLDETIGRSK